MNVKAQIIAWNNPSTAGGCGDFSLNAYWGGGYKNVFYLNGDLGRSEFANTIETVTDKFGQDVRVQDISVEKFGLSVIITTPLLSFLHTISKHDNKQIYFEATQQTYNIKNITIDDQGQRLDPNQLVIITFEDEAISNINGGNSVLNSQKLAYFDNNNDGVKDLNGFARFNLTTFDTWQLYYESNGVTPATSGNVIMSVYAVSQTGLESLVGVFRGAFGALFSDSTKWQSSQQIWDYFNILDSVGHTNSIEFDKKAFAEDNGYYSDEIEDRAVNIRFELSVNGSTKQPTTLALVYTVAGSFSSSGIIDTATGLYAVTTIGHFRHKNTLSTIQDVRKPLGGGASTLISSAILYSVTPAANTYTLDIAPAAEQSYDGALTTPKGYVSSNFRGSLGTGDFILAPDRNFAVSQSLNILNFTIGTTPYLFNFYWKYIRAVVFPTLGNIPVAGDAKVLLDAVLVNTLPTITPAVNLVIGNQNITLPDTGIHTIKIFLPTTTGYEIFTEFQAQLKALF